MNGTGNPERTGGFPRYRLMFTMEAVTYASHTTFLNVSSSLKPNQMQLCQASD